MSDDDGYTLLETVVAMALFVGVLIPLISILGNFMLDASADQLRLALLAAEAELCSQQAHQTFPAEGSKIEGGLIIHRSARKEGNLVEVSVSVASGRAPDRTVLLLTKTFLTNR